MKAAPDLIEVGIWGSVKWQIQLSGEASRYIYFIRKFDYN